MIPDKIKSIINSCNTHQQLATCIKWIDYIYPFDEQRAEAYDVVRLRKDELELKTN
jgi:hypothetical protein